MKPLFLISLSKYSTWNDYKISALKPKYPYVELRIGWVEKTGEYIDKQTKRITEELKIKKDFV